MCVLNKPVYFEGNTENLNEHKDWHQSALKNIQPNVKGLPKSPNTKLLHSLVLRTRCRISSLVSVSPNIEYMPIDRDILNYGRDENKIVQCSSL